MRRTVLPSPKTSQAKPRRGSKSIGAAFLKPRGVLGSVARTRPLVRSPVPGTNDLTKNLLSSWALVGDAPGARLARTRGSTANWLLFEQELPKAGTPLV